jgi:HSP20 family protein
MTIVRWEPLRELSSLQSEMNRLFNTVFDGPQAGSAGARRWVPAMDLLETADAFVLRADLPGMGQDDVKIELDDNVLTISGERAAEHEDRQEGFYRLERAFGRFSRSLTLPKGVDQDAVAASFTNGVLEVRIPKPAQAKPRRIEISVSGEPRTQEPEAIEGTGTPTAA